MKKTIYKVVYYTLECSPYDHSERNYTTKDFVSRKEALAFAKEATKVYPAQIVVKAITEEFLLDLRDTDNYQENRAIP
jgi:hypothetical protein